MNNNSFEKTVVLVIIARLHFGNMAEPGPTRYLRRITTVLLAIHNRFPEVNKANQLKLKHIEWIKNYWFVDQKLASSTQSDYIRALKLLIMALNKEQHWFGPLKLIAKNDGGRKMKVSASKSRKKLSNHPKLPKACKV